MSTPAVISVNGRRTRVRIDGDPAHPPAVLIHGIGRRRRASHRDRAGYIRDAVLAHARRRAAARGRPRLTRHVDRSLLVEQNCRGPLPARDLEADQRGEHGDGDQHAGDDRRDQQAVKNGLVDPIIG
jgi:hypothetical protein